MPPVLNVGLPAAHYEAILAKEGLTPEPEPQFCGECGLPDCGPDLIALVEALDPVMEDYEISLADLADAISRKPGGLARFVFGAVGQ